MFYRQYVSRSPLPAVCQLLFFPGSRSGAVLLQFFSGSLLAADIDSLRAAVLYPKPYTLHFRSAASSPLAAGSSGCRPAIHRPFPHVWAAWLPLTALIVSADRIASPYQLTVSADRTSRPLFLQRALLDSDVQK